MASNVEEALGQAATSDLFIIASATDECQEGVTLARSILECVPDAAVIMYCGNDSITARVSGLEAGCSDVIPDTITTEELLARLENQIMHSTANRQLLSQVQAANQIAMQAMVNTSDLGTNIQFLLECVNCRNYDELGMRLFQTLRYYGLQCSVQFRGAQGIKNMESNGMSKDLESRLLFELKDSGRYIDYGRRTIVNYGRVSILIRNMPPADTEKYGQIKDNTFALLQGADAQIGAIDNMEALSRERDFMEKITLRMQMLIQNIEESNQQIIRGCASVVEDLIGDVESSLAVLGLTQHQEETFMNIMHRGLQQINNQVSLGLRVDESFRRLLSHIQDSLSNPEEGQ